MPRTPDVIPGNPGIRVTQAGDQVKTVLLHLLRIRPEIHVANRLAWDAGKGGGVHCFLFLRECRHVPPMAWRDLLGGHDLDGPVALAEHGQVVGTGVTIGVDNARAA